MSQVKSSNHSPACREAPLPHCLPTCPMRSTVMSPVLRDELLDITRHQRRPPVCRHPDIQHNRRMHRLYVGMWLTLLFIPFHFGLSWIASQL